MAYRTIPVLALLLSLSQAVGLAAQRAPAFQITDNSLLVEEAFNQERGVFQNILLVQRAGVGGDWALEFTQEWPLWSQRHQGSFTVPVGLADGTLGNIFFHYRYQLRSEDESGPAISPRASISLATGTDDGYKMGLQLNLPASRQYGDVYVHANAGLTWVRREAGLSGVAGEGTVGLLTPHVAGSAIWRAAPLVHLLVESVARFEEAESLTCCGTDYETVWVLSPGFRVGKNLGDKQLVFGAGLPIDLAGPREASLLLYLSYELPFSR